MKLKTGGVSSNQLTQKFSKQGDMVTLTRGQFFGETNNTMNISGVTLTDTEYTHEKVDWHYHENAYFTLILEGSVIEGNKKEVYQCPAGTLLFHNCQEAHYNVKPKGFTRGFHIEISPGWFKTNEMDLLGLEGSINLFHPEIKIGAYSIFREYKMNDGASEVAIHSLLINALSQMSNTQEGPSKTIPSWVIMLREMLNDDFSEEWTLISLSNTLGIHPVHLSRSFAKYFGCNIGEYLRMIKIQRALFMLSDKDLSLSDIAYDCGFADQSHFTRCFKAVNHLKPSQFRNILLK
jgi:AraC-like DNA-binding protein